MSTLNKIDTVIGVVGIAATAVELMMKVAKWYNKKYGGNKKKEEPPITRPIIRGQKKWQ